METRQSFCPKCKARVRLAVDRAPTLHGQATLNDGGALVCLDYQGRCSGGDCALTGRPGIVMAYRLAKSHLNDGRWVKYKAQCPACDTESVLEVLDNRHVFCTVCETTSTIDAV